MKNNGFCLKMLMWDKVSCVMQVPDQLEKTGLRL